MGKYSQLLVVLVHFNCTNIPLWLHCTFGYRGWVLELRFGWVQEYSNELRFQLKSCKSDANVGHWWLPHILSLP